MTALRLDRIELQNFRCFSQCALDFHPQLTVLVADNGSGKTALLDATALALSTYVHAVYSDEPLRRIDRGDVRLVPTEGRMDPSLPTSYKARGQIAGSGVAWESSVGKFDKKVRATTKSLSEVRKAAAPLIRDDAVLPMVAYYGTGRLWSEQRLTAHRRTSITDVHERLTSYTDCLTSSSSFKGVSAWYGRRVQELDAPKFGESTRVNLDLIAAVKEATATVLRPTGWLNLNWENSLGALVAEHERQGRLPVSLLSDGVRTMLALVADVARRCASLNPKLAEKAARETPGVLLIDEVDMHLHPRWQQLVIGLLQEAFPAIQIVVTTHSPHVLSTVDKASIRVLSREDGDIMISTPRLQTRGTISGDVLADVMHVDPIPPIAETELLSQYRALIEDGKAATSEAAELLEKLRAHFGERHPVMLECDRLLKFQQFRLKRETKKGQ